MTPADAVSLASSIALVLLGIALMLSIIRIAVGPTLADRVLALDLLTTLVMGFIGALAIRTGLTLYIDIAISLALLGFLATVALARYVASRQGVQEDKP
jgi:multicomponent Na+:H+ antiporter subunit F